MKKLLLAAAFVFAVPAFAQFRVEVQLPSIVFPTPPRLVVVEPGIQVVEDYDEEVFFVDDYYWHRRNGNWYRTTTHNGVWVQVEPRWVPPRLAYYNPGQFRRWHGNDRERRAWQDWQTRNQYRREERREQEYREWKERARQERERDRERELAERREREHERERRENRREERWDDRRDDRRDGRHEHGAGPIAAPPPGHQSGPVALPPPTNRPTHPAGPNPTPGPNGPPPPPGRAPVVH